MTDDWVIIDEFPNYVINRFGDIQSRKTGHPLTTSRNRQGVEKISLYQDGRYSTVGVALLVAGVFLPEPPRSDFTTPIQLDGDRMNCAASNLVWRPRWFAIKYHQERKIDPFKNWNHSFRMIETQEVFEHPKYCAVKYGLLEDGNHGILNAIMNSGKTIFPTWFTFNWT